jgi:hypothetical protein
MEVIFIIPTAPTQAPKVIDTHIMYVDTRLRAESGINFCHVLKIKNLSHDSPSLTSGNQKNSGKAPNFVKRASLISSVFNSLSPNRLKVVSANSKIELENDCTIKYFIILLIDRFDLEIIRGTNAIILISSLSHN